MADNNESEVCANLVGIISGCILGTLAVCTAITGIIIYFICKKQSKSKLKYIANARNIGGQNFSSIESSLETGLHNSGYTTDGTEGNDVFMMMNNKPSVEERRSSTLNRTLSVPHKNVDCVEVNLVGKEVSGLGFDVKGNPRDGISISNIHERGAAKENSLIKVGDKVLSLTISFDNMVYEDALTLLSYASPYPITMVLGKKKKSKDKENGSIIKKAENIQKIEDDESSLSSITKSHELSDSESESGHGGTGDEESDDDTQKRAPTHLPQNIKSLVESKKSGKQAVEVIEDRTKHQILSPTSLDRDIQRDLQLSNGAQSALDMILSKHSTDITIES